MRRRQRPVLMEIVGVNHSTGNHTVVATGNQEQGATLPIEVQSAPRTDCCGSRESLRNSPNQPFMKRDNRPPGQRVCNSACKL